MNNTRTFLKHLVLALAVGSLAVPFAALAHPGGPGGGPGGPVQHAPAPRHGPRMGPGPMVQALPGPHVSILFGGLCYYFVGGLFYLSQGPGFAAVVPPVGLVIPALPPAHTVLVVGGRSYYCANDVYYIQAPAGYRVVEAPATVVVQEPATQRTTASDGLPDSVTIVLENPNGSRTPVTLNRTPDGWKGPKGELYDSLPTQEQLLPYYGLTAQTQGQTL